MSAPTGVGAALQASAVPAGAEHAVAAGAASPEAPPRTLPPPQVEEVANAETRRPNAHVADLLGTTLGHCTHPSGRTTSLRHLGNTCFLDAVLAALAHNPQLRHWALRHRESCGTPVELLDACAACCHAQDIVDITAVVQPRVVEPHASVHRGNWNPKFRNLFLHDAHAAFAAVIAACDAVEHARAAVCPRCQCGRRVHVILLAVPRRNCRRHHSLLPLQLDDHHL